MGAEPKFCPYCGSTNITVFMVDWEAKPAEDRDNEAIISEHQCYDCGNQSFWT